MLYPIAWIAAVAIAVAVVARQPARIALCRPEYWRWLLVPWKLLTFAIATLGLIALAPFMRDPYWDGIDVLFMSLLTFATAPWVVAVLWRTLLRKASRVESYVAVCAALFSASWSFDLYWTLRNGAYPDVWLPNLLASSSLYLMAGLFWNLGWSPRRGVGFAFRDGEWPRASAQRFAPIKRVALVYMLCVAVAVIVPFLC
jgi:hypothetical protein